MVMEHEIDKMKQKLGKKIVKMMKVMINSQEEKRSLQEIDGRE